MEIQTKLARTEKDEINVRKGQKVEKKARDVQEREEDRGDCLWFLPFCGPNCSLILFLL